MDNQVELEGTARSGPVFSHENHGVSFYRFFLEVERLSGQRDVLPVLVTSSQEGQVHAGARIHLRGELRSFNNRSGAGRRLVLTVRTRELLPPSGREINQLTLSGVLCKPPVFRRTPLGRSICDLMLAVPRRYGRADYLPVIAWGRLALELQNRSSGDDVSLLGRFQSRTYQKVLPDGVEERVAYEVSLMELTP